MCPFSFYNLFRLVRLLSNLDRMSCNFCPLVPPFRTKSGLSAHMLQAHGPWALGAHGIDSDGEEVLRRSRRDIPIHLDYREQDSSDKESSDDEMEVKPEVIEIDDKEHSPPAQKRDSVST